MIEYIPIKAISDLQKKLNDMAINFPYESGISLLADTIGKVGDQISILNNTLANTPIVTINTTLPHGVLETISIGGVAMKKTFWSNFPYKTDLNGLAACNLTVDNTENGAALFSEIWYNQSRGMNIVNNANEIVLGLPNGKGTIKKNIHIFTRGNVQTLGNTLASLLGVVISGMRIPDQGTPVQFKVEGV